VRRTPGCIGSGSVLAYFGGFGDDDDRVTRKVNDLLILCYHAVSPGWPTEFAIDPRRLEAQVRFLLRRGYRPATLTAAVEGSPRGKTVVITFDDAYRSVLHEGLSVLERLGVPATVFVPSAFATSQEPMAWAEMADWLGTPFEAELDCMSWEELRRLSAAGWEIGSHSSSHRDLTSLGDAELEAELRGSRQECEGELQRPCTALAYPFSAYDERVKAMARDAGYATAAILDNHLAIPEGSRPGPGGGGSDPFELLRSGIYRGDGWPRFAAKTSRVARRARDSGPWRLAAGALSR
jgi:peptidoglycan/xylan/chitin deacetylase (PgdA/CDA1 family)